MEVSPADIMGELEESSRRGEACYFREGHFNQRGHAVLAEALVPAVMQYHSTH